jgi:hypothetical protein
MEEDTYPYILIISENELNLFHGLKSAHKFDGLNEGKNTC